jgi:hypothetical protein
VAQEKMLSEVVQGVRALSGQLSAGYDQPYHFVVAMLACMHAAGWNDIDYGTLAVVSGVGLSFGYQRHTCVHVYALQNGATDRIADATGCQFEWKTCEELEENWAWTTASIDEGRPVAAEYAEYHVIAGYAAGYSTGETPEERRWYVVANEPITDFDGAWLDWAQIQKLHQDCGWSRFRCRYGGKGEAQPAAETTKNVIGWLVEWSEQHPAKGQDRFKDAVFGLEAIEAYARDLSDMSLTVEKDFDWGNNACHAITPQWTTRRHIGTYLERQAVLFDAPVQTHILDAASSYRAADAAWIVFDEQLGQRYVSRDGGKQAEGWANPQRRKAGSDAVYQALAHERAALAALTKALDRF